jgi:hypothetical protein
VARSGAARSRRTTSTVQISGRAAIEKSRFDPLDNILERRLGGALGRITSTRFARFASESVKRGGSEGAFPKIFFTGNFARAERYRRTQLTPLSRVM